MNRPAPTAPALPPQIVVASVHDGAKEILPPRALRTLKYKARTLDIDKTCAKAFLKGVKQRLGHIKMVSCWMNYFPYPMPVFSA